MWWHVTGELDWSRLEPLLDSGERDRLAALRRDADRERFVLAAALARAALGHELGLSPTAIRLDRSCPRCGAPHGKPRGRGTAAALELSVTHGGRLVGVALHPRAAVGIDVEPTHRAPDADELAATVLDAHERGALERYAGPSRARRAEGFLRLWTRKEALTKMTGDGLAVPLTDLRVSGPGQPARLLGWTGREAWCGRTTLLDLHPPLPDHVAAAAVGEPGVRAHERDGTALLASLE